VVALRRAYGDVGETAPLCRCPGLDGCRLCRSRDASCHYDSASMFLGIAMRRVLTGTDRLAACNSTPLQHFLVLHTSG